MTTSPFQAVSADLSCRAKIFVYGQHGTGKTTLGLAFPKVAVIDLERGTDQWAATYQFDRLPTTDLESIVAAVDWLATARHDYRTLLIDPITIYWEAVQRKWSQVFLERKRDGKGHHEDFYEFQPADWSTIKAEWKSFFRRLLELDMNVVCTAREKDRYSKTALMQVIGSTFDSEKTLPYLFDAVLRLERDRNGFHVTVEKDRGLRIGKAEFSATSPQATFSVLASSYGLSNIERESTPMTLATAEQAARFRELVTVLALPADRVIQRLQSYSVDTPEELTATNAAAIISRLETALSQRNGGV